MKILANDGISGAGIQTLEKGGFEVLTTKVAQEQLAEYINQKKVEILLVRSATKVRKELIDQTSLRVIGRGGVGMDNIDVDYAKEKGIHVINTPAASSASVAELVIAHLFALVRGLHDANRKMPLEGDTKFKELKKSYSKSFELRGKTLGVIGFGRIGTEVLKEAIGLGMNVLVSNLEQEPKTIELTFFDGQKLAFKITPVSKEKVIQNADFISLHVPAQKEYIIGKKELEQMKDGVILINASRGGVVNEKALVEAIDKGKVRSAALDVFENEPKPDISLLMNPDLSLSPHIGGSTLEAQERIGLELAEKIIDIYK